MSGDEQGRLQLVVRRPVELVSEDVIAAQATPLKAFNTQIDLSGLRDESIYLPMDVDQAQFSRWKSGQHNPPLNRIEELTRICGKALLVQKLAWDLGFGLHMRKSEAEKRADDLQKKLDEAELENRVLMKALGARK